MKRLLWFLGYLNMLPMLLAGALLLLLAKVFGQVTWVVWGPYPAPHTVLVKLDGFVARLLGKPSGGRILYAQTVGPFMFFYHEPDDQRLKHEGRHVWQQAVFGILQPVIYALSILYGLVRYRSLRLAYENVIWERDARKAAGEDV